MLILTWIVTWLCLLVSLLCLLVFFLFDPHPSWLGFTLAGLGGGLLLLVVQAFMVENLIGKN